MREPMPRRWLCQRSARAQSSRPTDAGDAPGEGAYVIGFAVHVEHDPDVSRPCFICPASGNYTVLYLGEYKPICGGCAHWYLERMLRLVEVDR